MNDKHRLSSEQVLDDYFFDLLAEPEEIEPAEEPLPLAGVEKGVEQGADDGSSPQDLDSAPEPDDRQDIESGDTTGEGTVPFDFEQLSESSEELDEGADEATISVELNLSPAASKMSSWVPQVQEAPLEALQAETRSLEAMPLEAERVEAIQPISFAEQPDAELEGVQRLLSQMSQMQSDIRQESDALIAVQTEADFLAVSYQESRQESPQAQQENPQTEIIAGTVVQADEDPAQAGSLAQREPAQYEPEREQPEPEVSVAPETQPGGDEPPDLWQQQQDMGAAFQALFFEVNGVTFAVPLTELGGIHQLGDVNRLLGRPPWYLGLMTNREHQLDVVDTARWVMPEKLSSDEHQQEYRYIVMLGESKWGLACHALHGTETLTEHSVRWREKAGKRPWLAGMVKEKMCALIHVNELISMLNAGLDVKSVI